MKASGLSVVVTVWNEEKTILDCLDAIFQQTCAPESLIIVDNNCIDKTIDIVNERCKSATCEVTVVKETVQGMTPAKKTGWKQALCDPKTKYIVKLDADTKLHDKALENISKYFDSHPNVGAITAKLVADKFVINMFLKLYMKLASWLHGFQILQGPCYVIRRDILEKIMADNLFPNDKEHHEDLFTTVMVVKTMQELNQKPEIGFSSDIIATWDDRSLSKNISWDYIRRFANSLFLK